MSRTIGLSRAQRWGKVIVPSLIPGMMLGVRVAASLAVIITLLVDIFGAGTGLGRLLVESQQRFDASAAWGLLLIVGPLRLPDELDAFVAGACSGSALGSTASRPRSSACAVDQSADHRRGNIFRRTPTGRGRSPCTSPDSCSTPAGPGRLRAAAAAHPSRRWRRLTGPDPLRRRASTNRVRTAGCSTS